MDEKTLIILQADVVGQMNLIDDVFATLKARTADLHPEDEAQLESSAYQLDCLRWFGTCQVSVDTPV